MSNILHFYKSVHNISTILRTYFGEFRLCPEFSNLKLIDGNHVEWKHIKFRKYSPLMCVLSSPLLFIADRFFYTPSFLRLYQRNFDFNIGSLFRTHCLSRVSSTLPILCVNNFNYTLHVWQESLLKSSEI
jgi:hypothetical protein